MKKDTENRPPDHSSPNASPPDSIYSTSTKFPLTGKGETQPDRSGAIGDRYHIMSVIGQGGMGIVYQCRDSNLKRIVAVKRLIEQGEQSKLAIQRFMREAQIIAKLDHRNIVRVYDASEDAQGPYIVMEYCPGTTIRDKNNNEQHVLSLNDLIKLHGKLKPEKAIALLTEIAEALSYAHKNGVVHRDIKPANVLFAADGLPKLADFGIAQIPTGGDKTDLGRGMGTLGYIAPEVLFRGESGDNRVDIFALGALLYELLSGNIHPLILDNIPLQFRALVLSCLQVDPGKRFRTVENFLAALRKTPLSDTDFVRPTIKPFQFSSGESAYTKEELMWLSEKNPEEAMKLLYNGSIEDWLNYLCEDEWRDRIKKIMDYGGDNRAGFIEWISGSRPFITRRGSQLNTADEVIKYFTENVSDGRYHIFTNEEAEFIGSWLKYIGEDKWAKRANDVKRLFKDRKQGLDAFLDLTNTLLRPAYEEHFRVQAKQENDEKTRKQQIMLLENQIKDAKLKIKKTEKITAVVVYLICIVIALLIGFIGITIFFESLSNKGRPPDGLPYFMYSLFGLVLLSAGYCAGEFFSKKIVESKVTRINKKINDMTSQLRSLENENKEYK
ncbi:MAG: hypothetical protein A2161_21590 [Candidatus Schekmanbacteria bacterium RBG_13_48_7]|uniref:Protein kinase domain-containing protein n=1 Tax=Candidatus Schekmanbacteria bacterium RBG_13_48_7 TaxID=1817878 RepID=A0A1F7RMY4_9BACT|nr:MAG: hypothetical protein A2161_21590 [Candidatus Schekmanbacteria bacterium RBG_13_48_7]